MSSQNNEAQCARCPFNIADRVCRKENGKHPDSCPTINQDDVAQEVLDHYRAPEYWEFARQASIQERDGYRDRERGYAKLRPAKPRIEEIMEFAERMSYTKLGLAFCIGLRKEASVVEKLFSARGFETVSAVCKVGRVEKQFLDLGDEDKIAPGEFEAMCNPILQAAVLNAAGTQFNILLGLCVGHDSLFLKHAEAPCTVLAVKDRVTGHNPLAPIYTHGSYYRAL